VQSLLLSLVGSVWLLPPLLPPPPHSACPWCASLSVVWLLPLLLPPLPSVRRRRGLCTAVPLTWW